MKFLADMGISPHTVSFLQTQGYDAIHLLDQHLEQLPDIEIFEKARYESRIILTHDVWTLPIFLRPLRLSFPV